MYVPGTVLNPLHISLPPTKSSWLHCEEGITVIFIFTAAQRSQVICWSSYSQKRWLELGQKAWQSRACAFCPPHQRNFVKLSNLSKGHRNGGVGKHSGQPGSVNLLTLAALPFTSDSSGCNMGITVMLTSARRLQKIKKTQHNVCARQFPLWPSSQWLCSSCLSVGPRLSSLKFSLCLSAQN